MGVPSSLPPQGGLTCAGGQETCFELAIPARCWLVGITVVQVQGADDYDFVAQFFNSENACRGASESDSEEEPTPGTGMLPPDLYEVTGPLAGVDGKLKYRAEDNGGVGFPFCSQDRDARGSKANGRSIWLRITPTDAAGDVEYAVAMTVDIYQP